MDAPHGCWLSVCRESLTAIAQECCKHNWICPGGSISQSSCCMDTYHPSWKPSKLDEQDMRDIAGDVRDVLLWIPSHGRARVGQPARTYLQLFCTDTGCSMGDLPRLMDDRDEWWERVREICASSPWWWYINLKFLEDIIIQNFTWS